MSTTLRDIVPERVQNLFGHTKSADTDEIVKGAIAGAVGGIVGTLAMAAFQQIWMRSTTLAEKFHQPSDEDRNRLKNAGVGEGEYPQSEPRSHHHRNSPSERLVETVFREVIHRPASRRTMTIGGSAVH